MSDEPNAFRDWMDERRLKAADVCEALHVSEQTVHQWRTYGVPERRRPHVERYMAEWTDPASTPPGITDAHSLRIEFDDAEIDDVSKAAGIVETNIREFIRRSAVHQARAEIAKRQTKEGPIQPLQRDQAKEA